MLGHSPRFPTHSTAASPRLSWTAAASTAACMITALAGCGGYASHPIVAEAERELTTNTRVAEALGEGAKRSSGVTGTSSDTDGMASLRFDVQGPKGTGTLVVEGRKFENDWGVTSLELRLPRGGERVVLTGDLEERTGVDTPKFDPSSQSGDSGQPAAPPPDVEIPLPPGVPAG